MLFPHHKDKGKEDKAAWKGEMDKKGAVLHSYRSSVLERGGRLLWLGQWEGRPERERTTLLRGKQPRFQKLNVKVERGLDADKKFFCFLYLP